MPDTIILTTQQVIGWVIGLLATNGVIIVGAIIGWVKVVKMIPKDLESASIKNAKDKKDAIDTMDDFIDKTINKSVSLNEKIMDLESQIQAVRREQRDSDCWIASLLFQMQEARLQPVTKEQAIARGCK
jgi:hypothetical protein